MIRRFRDNVSLFELILVMLPIPDSDSVSKGFIGFASLCGVVPYILVTGIVRSLLVLSTFVLGGGGIV